jgi:hypothetical protein
MRRAKQLGRFWVGTLHGGHGRGQEEAEDRSIRDDVKVAWTGIVGAAGQLFVDGFQRRGVNMYDHFAVTSDGLRELFLARRFPRVCRTAASIVVHVKLER